MSYLRFWPTFSMAGFSRIGRRAASVCSGSSRCLALRRAHRDVIRLPLLPGERIADNLGEPRGDVRGLGVEREFAFAGSSCINQPHQSLRRVDGLVADLPLDGPRLDLRPHLVGERVKTELGETAPSLLQDQSRCSRPRPSRFRSACTNRAAPACGWQTPARGRAIRFSLRLPRQLVDVLVNAFQRVVLCPTARARASARSAARRGCYRPGRRPASENRRPDRAARPSRPSARLGPSPAFFRMLYSRTRSVMSWRQSLSAVTMKHSPPLSSVTRRDRRQHVVGLVPFALQHRECP